LRSEQMARQELVERESQLRRQLYVSDIAGAWAAWSSGDAQRALGLLCRQVPTHESPTDMREFTWHYLATRCDERKVTTLNGRERRTRCVRLRCPGPCAGKWRPRVSPVALPPFNRGASPRVCPHRAQQRSTRTGVADCAPTANHDHSQAVTESRGPLGTRLNEWIRVPSRTHGTQR
jgi:hypothetical protein